MTRRRRTVAERVIAEFNRQLRLALSAKARRRSEGAKRAWATRRRRERALEPEPVPTLADADRLGTLSEADTERLITEVTTVNGRTP